MALLALPVLPLVGPMFRSIPAIPGLHNFPTHSHTRKADSASSATSRASRAAACVGSPGLWPNGAFHVHIAVPAEPPHGMYQSE